MKWPPWRSWFNRWPQLDDRSSSLLTLLFCFLSLWLVDLHHAYSPFRLHIVQLLQCATFKGCYTRKELMKDLNPAAWLVPDLQWAPSACFGQTVKPWGDTQTWCPSVRPVLGRRCSVGVSLRNTQNWQLCYWHPDLIAECKFTLSMCDRCERVCRDRSEHHPAWPVWQWVSDGPGRLHLFLAPFPIFMKH